jgi:hypothetical protein
LERAQNFPSEVVFFVGNKLWLLGDSGAERFLNKNLEEEN